MTIATKPAVGYAKENLIDLEKVRGSGSGGKIIKKDVMQYAEIRQEILHITLQDVTDDAPTAEFLEIGFSGLDFFSGLIQEAYLTELTWPTVAERYKKLRRSDPEISMVRQAFTTLGSSTTMEFKTDAKDPTDDDLAATEYSNSVLDGLEGGTATFRDTLLANVPFYAWGWWEIVWALRRDDWFSDDPDDDWVPNANDGLPGIRRLGWRDPTSFVRWELTEKGRVLGMTQRAGNLGNEVTIPAKKSIHITFGDPNNPEGLSPLEAIHRLERIKYAFEFIFGRGMERSAGYAKFSTKAKLTTADKTAIKKAARAILSAQENNYLALPNSIEADIIDSAFQSADALLNAIKFYSISKLQMYNMQWIAMSTTSGTGSFAAMDDASGMFVQYFNAMLQGFAQQIDRQLGRAIFSQPEVIERFPNMTQRPKFTISQIDKTVDLDKIAAFIDKFSEIGEIGSQDLIAIRKASRFMPESLPTEDEVVRRPGDSEPFRNMAMFTNYLDWIITEFRAIEGDFPAQRTDYRNTVFDVISDYLLTSGARVTRFRNEMKQAVADNFVAAFVTGYLEASGAESADEIDATDRSWLAARQASEIANVDMLFSSLRETKVDMIENPDDEGPTVSDIADQRANGYGRTLDSIYNQGLLRGDKNKMLTFTGSDGDESCTTCQKWKGKRHSANFWIKRDLIPRPGNEMFVCGGWNCKHKFVDDDGNVVTINV